MPRFNIGQLLLLTALAALLVALGTTLYTRARGMFTPEAVAYAPDGQTMAVRYTDGSVFVWNANGRRIASFDTRESWINWSWADRQIHLLNDERLLVNNDIGQFQLWEIDTGKPSQPFGPANMNPVDGAIGVSGDGKTAATFAIASAQPKVEIWDLETGQKQKTLTAVMGAPSAIVLSEDGKRMALLNMQDAVEIWDVEAEELIAGPHAFQQKHISNAWSFDVSDDFRAAALSESGRDVETATASVQLLNLANGERAEVTVAHAVVGVRLSPDGTRLAALGRGDEVTVLDTANGETVTTLAPLHKTPAFQMPQIFGESAPLDFSPDGTQLLVASNMEVGIHDAANGKLKRRLWTSQESLTKWFFAPAFIGWGALWGMARRRHRQSDARARDDVIDAELAHPEEASDELVNVRPPKSLITVWILLGIGGTMAIVWSMFLLFAEVGCLAFTPFPYYSLFVGLTTIAAGTGRRTDRIPLIYSVQMGNILCCDFVNFCLGIAGLILFYRPAAQIHVARGES